MRGKKAKKRTIQVDPIYNNRLLSKLINRTMKNGKKIAAQKQIYKALEIVEKTAKQDPLEIFRQALEKIKPNMEVRSRRVGGAAYQIPVPVKGDRKESLAIRWLIMAARNRSNTAYKSFAEKLSAELLDAFEGKGEAVKKKETSHKMAEANKAFAHFRW